MKNILLNLYKKPFFNWAKNQFSNTWSIINSMILTLLRFVKKISKIADVSSEFTVVQLFSTLKEFANWGRSSWLKINFLKISLEIKVNCNVLHLCDVATYPIMENLKMRNRKIKLLRQNSKDLKVKDFCTFFFLIFFLFSRHQINCKFLNKELL